MCQELYKYLLCARNLFYPSWSLQQPNEIDTIIIIPRPGVTQGHAGPVQLYCAHNEPCTWFNALVLPR